MTLVTRLSLHHGFHGFSLGLFLAVQTLFLLDKGLTLAQLGILFGTFGLASALFELPLGALADIHGRIRVFRWSLMISILGFACAALVNEFWLLLPFMALMGLARALESGTIDAWQIEQINAQGLRDQLGALAGRFQGIGAGGLAVGAVLGGYLPDWLPVLPEDWPPSTINLLAVASLLSIHLCLLPWLFAEGESRHAHEDSPTLRQQIQTTLQQVIAHPDLRLLFLVAFVFGLALVSLEIYWQPFVRQLQESASYEIFGWLAMGYFAAAAVGPILYGALSQKLSIGARSQIVLILAVSAPLLWLMAQQSSILGFALCYFSFMAVFACINVPVQILMNDNIGDDQRSTLFSSFSLTISVGGAVSSYGLSQIVQLFGISVVWQSIAAALILTLIIVLAVRSHTAAESQA